VIRGASLALVVASATSAFADPQTADKHAAEATRLVQAGDLKGAAVEFAKAAAEDPSRPELFCNVGISFYRAQDHARAHLWLARCLDLSALDVGFVENARAALTATEAAIRETDHTPVTFTMKPAASVHIAEFQIAEAFVGNRVVWLPFGTHHVTARAPGFRDQTIEVKTDSKTPKTITIILEPDTGEPIKPPPPPPPKPARPTKLPAIMSTVGTVAAFGIAGYAFNRARTAADLAQTALDNETFAGDQSTVNRWNTTFAISGSLAVVGTAATAYLWYRAFRTNVEIKPALGGGVAVMYRGRF
jgi:hypothetical protein